MYWMGVMFILFFCMHTKKEMTDTTVLSLACPTWTVGENKKELLKL